MLAGRALDYRLKRNGKSPLEKAQAAGYPRKITSIPEGPFIRFIVGDDCDFDSLVGGTCQWTGGDQKTGMDVA